MEPIKENPTLTDSERIQLQEYLSCMDELAAQEPEYSAFNREVQEAWEVWNKKGVDLNHKYHDVIIKALSFSLENLEDDPQSVAQILKAFISEDPQERKQASLALHTRLATISQYGIMNDKASIALISELPTEREIDGQLKLMWTVNQAGKNKNRPPIPSYIAIGYTGDETKIKTGMRITSKDDAVFHAFSNIVFLLQQSGVSYPYFISPEDIWRTMNGIKGTKKTPTAKQLEDVCRRMDKMRFTSLYMDISAEIEANYITIDDDRLCGGRIETYYLKADKAEFITEKGRIISGYRVEEMPFLYQYNYAKGHIVLIPYELLDTSDTTGNEGYTVEIRNYLLLQIAKLYRRDRNNNKILYDTLYREATIPTPEERADRNKYKNEASYKTTIKRYAQKDREKIAALLESWKRKKWILDYKQCKTGRNFTGIEITLNPDNYTPMSRRKKPEISQK